jgi:hypothetical protein
VLDCLLVEEGRCEGGWSPHSWLVAANGLPAAGLPWHRVDGGPPAVRALLADGVPMNGVLRHECSWRREHSAGAAPGDARTQDLARSKRRRALASPRGGGVCFMS